MSSMDNVKINAAYVATWQMNNPQLLKFKTDGKYLYYQDEKLDISNVYMQDLFRNSNLFYNINTISAQDLFNIIKLHTLAIEINERKLNIKVRSMNLMNSQQLDNKTNQSTITVDEYFSLCQANDLKTEDLIKKKKFEKFILLCQEYEQNLTPEAESILKEYRNKQMALVAKQNIPEDQKFNLMNFPNEEETVNNIEENAPVRKLSKAGYVDSTIILIVLLNLGFIVALTFLGK